MKNYRNYVFAAMLAALVMMGTAFMPIKLPSFTGYIHIGDALVYVAGSILPFPFSMFSAGIGACLADVVTGYAHFAPFTFVIKMLMALCFSSRSEKILSKRNLTAVVGAGIINIGGYYLTEMVINRQDTFLKTAVTAAGSLYGNLIQSVGSAVIFIVIALALDKMNFKKTLEKMY